MNIVECSNPRCHTLVSFQALPFYRDCSEFSIGSKD